MGWGWLKAIGKGAAKAAPVILPLVLPPSAGAHVANLVGLAEAAKGSGHGAAKRDAVVLGLASALATAEGVSGVDLLNDAAFVAAAGNAIDAFVALENCVDNIKSLREKDGE